MCPGHGGPGQPMVWFQSVQRPDNQEKRCFKSQSPQRGTVSSLTVRQREGALPSWIHLSFSRSSTDWMRPPTFGKTIYFTPSTNSYVQIPTAPFRSRASYSISLSLYFSSYNTEMIILASETFCAY